MPSNHLFLCRPLLLLPPIPPSIRAFAAAAAKSLQSCLTLSDPMDCSPPGSPSMGFSRREYLYQFLIFASLCRRLSASSSGSAEKNLPVIQYAQVWSLGLEDPLEEGTATHFSILAWRIPWTEECEATVRVAKSQTGLKWLSTHACRRWQCYLLWLSHLEFKVYSV